MLLIPRANVESMEPRNKTGVIGDTNHPITTSGSPHELTTRTPTIPHPSNLAGINERQLQITDGL